MQSFNLTLVAGPPGVGKTTWISQLFKDALSPLFYLHPGAQESVDLAPIGYCFPWVSIIPDDRASSVLADLPDEAQVFIGLGFYANLKSLLLAFLPGQRIAIVPPGLESSEWHDWADKVIPGNNNPASDSLPAIWKPPLTGQVFAPPSLDEVLIELTEGAFCRTGRRSEPCMRTLDTKTTEK